MKKIVICMATALLMIALAGCTIVVENGVAKPVSAIRVRGESSEVLTITGLYQGLADSNFFEVQATDTQDTYKAFMITDTVRAHFEALGLQKDERVKVEYKENEYGQLETMAIERTDTD